MTGVRLQAWAVNFLSDTMSRPVLQPHPTSNPMGTVVSFPGGKVTGAWSWPLTSI